MKAYLVQAIGFLFAIFYFLFITVAVLGTAWMSSSSGMMLVRLW